MTNHSPVARAKKNGPPSLHLARAKGIKTMHELHEPQAQARATRTPATAKSRAAFPIIPNCWSLVFYLDAVSSAASHLTAESMAGAHPNDFAAKTAG